MPVGSATWYQSEEISERSKSLHIFREMAWMPHLDTVQSKLHEFFQSLAATVLTRMSPHRDGTRGMRELDSFADLESCLWNESRPARAEITVERFARIAYVSAANERTRDMRSSNSSPSRFCHHGLEIDVDTEMTKTLDDVLRARLACITKREEMRLELVSPGDMKREKMNLARPVMRA